MCFFWIGVEQMKPCDNCIKNLSWIGCSDYTCEDYYKNWIKERVAYERHADPQEPEPLLNYHDDDREV